MSKLIVYTYNTENKAAEVLQAVSGMKQENVQRPLIPLEEAAMALAQASEHQPIAAAIDSEDSA